VRFMAILSVKRSVTPAGAGPLHKLASSAP
jgi:hypothetical protein